MDQKILLEISRTVANAINANQFDNLGADLNQLIPDNLSRADRAAFLTEAHVYSLVCEQPGYDPDGKPGYLPADADLKAAVLNEINAMIEADFDKSEHRETWQLIKSNIESTPEEEFLPGVAVNCPDDYLLNLDRVNCAEALQKFNCLPAWASQFTARAID